MYYLKRIAYRSPEYREMVLLRTAILRTPWGLTFSENDQRKERTDLFLACFRRGDAVMVGCCVLTPIDKRVIRLRQMAVKEDFQKQGIGRKLVIFAEKEAFVAGFSMMTLHAREKAVPFYEKMGFERGGARFMEVTLPHFKMKKNLNKGETRNLS